MVGDATIDQDVPSQCSASVLSTDELVSWYAPTAQQSEEELQLTELSQLYSAPLFVESTIDQRLPSQCTINVPLCAHPTAQQSDVELQDMDCSTPLLA